jgi:hypothetical protein
MRALDDWRRDNWKVADRDRAGSPAFVGVDMLDGDGVRRNLSWCDNVTDGSATLEARHGTVRWRRYQWRQRACRWRPFCDGRENASRVDN